VIISVCGPIGVGKSLLVESISNHTEFQLPTNNNALFDSYFFNDPTRWGLHYLSSHIAKHFNRHNSVSDRSESGQKFVFDQSVYEEIVYAEVLYDYGLITFDEFKLVRYLHDGVIGSIKKPDLFLYLQVPDQSLCDLSAIRTKECQLGSKFVSAFNARLSRFFHNHADWLPVKRLDWRGIDSLSEVLHIIEPPVL
jgi:deoxyadenosine/deoxycytidine kinase